MNAATIGAIAAAAVSVIGAIAALVGVILHSNNPNAHK